MDTFTSGKSPDEAADALQSLPAVLAGETGDPNAGAMLREIGETMLHLVHDDFLVKASGGTGADGVTWPPLHRESVAYSRGAPKKAAGERPRGLLTPAQDKRWRGIYASLLGRYGGGKTAQGNAAAVAWTILKAEGARTVLDTYGDRQVMMLIDSGELLASLTPGSGHPDQVLIVDATTGTVTFGSAVKYAMTLHHGSAAKNIKPRPLWPEELPPAWQEKIEEVIARWTGVIIRTLI